MNALPRISCLVKVVFGTLPLESVVEDSKFAFIIGPASVSNANMRVGEAYPLDP